MAKIINIINLSKIERKFAFPLCVKNIGKVKVTGDRYRGIHSQNIEFCFRLKSSAKHAVDIIDGRTFNSMFPHLFIKKPLKLHQYDYKNEREAFFIIYPASLKDKFREFGIDLNKTIIEFNNNHKIKSIIEQLLELSQHCHQIGVADEIDLLSFNLICQAFYAEKSLNIDKKNNEDELKIREISSYLKLHYKDDISLNAIIKRYGFSRRNFYRHWSKLFSISPAQYIMQLKLEEACYLLENHSYSINEIADILNFSDTTYFITIFKKYNLVTPLLYRKRYTERY